MIDSFDVWLGDVVRVFHELSPSDDDTGVVIAKLLGFSTLTHIYQEKPFKDEPEQLTEKLEPRPPEQPPVKKPKPKPKPEQLEPEVAEPRLTRLKPIAFDPPQSGSSATPLEPPDLRSMGEALPYEPLFVKHWTRDILSVGLATKSPNGPVDELRIIEKMARLQPIDSLPRHPCPSLHKGVQVLVDIGKGMDPFVRDQDELLVEIQRTFGLDSVWKLQFRDSPTRGAGVGPVWTWEAYSPPPVGTPVLILTNLGIGGPRFYSERSYKKEWLAFSKLLKRRSCPLMAFVPYPPGRWPRWAKNNINIMEWDRTTTVGTVRRIAGRFAER